MFFTADMLIAHAVGDYILQNDWQANEKTKKSVAALAHAFTYTLPFLFITQSLAALAIIMVTHFIIDRWRLARYICYVKNFLQPKIIPIGKEWYVCDGGATQVDKLSRNHKWEDCSTTGYHKDRPAWLAVWLMIIADNVIHVFCNGLAIYFLG